MINYNKICVFDFETDGCDPTVCSPVQLAAIMVDPISLEVIPNSEFNVNFKPEVIEENANFVYTTDILEFHAKVRGSTKEDILTTWKQYPKQQLSWNLFTNYLDKYHTKRSQRSQFSAPLAAGYNIYRFDLPIVDRLSQRHGNVNKERKTNLFFPRDVLDVMNLMFYWFEHNTDLKSYSLDTVRDYFGITKQGGHDALKDVKDTANILVRFLKLHRGLATKIQFQHAFGDSV